MSEAIENTNLEPVEEKKSFKEKMQAKAADFNEKHPKITKAAKTTGKVIGAGLLVVGGFLVGNAVANSGSDETDIIDGDYYEIVDDGPREDD